MAERRERDWLNFPKFGGRYKFIDSKAQQTPNRMNINYGHTHHNQNA